MNELIRATEETKIGDGYAVHIVAKLQSLDYLYPVMMAQEVSVCLPDSASRMVTT